MQEFAIESASWSRYLLLRMVTHHGKEPVCTLNSVRVFGTTEAEDLEAQLSALADEKPAGGSAVAAPPHGGAAVMPHSHAQALPASDSPQAAAGHSSGATVSPKTSRAPHATRSRAGQLIARDAGKAKGSAGAKTPRSAWGRWYQAKRRKPRAPTTTGEAAWERLDQERPFHVLNEAAPVVMQPQRRTGPPSSKDVSGSHRASSAAHESERAARPRRSGGDPSSPEQRDRAPSKQQAREELGEGAMGSQRVADPQRRGRNERAAAADSSADLEHIVATQHKGEKADATGGAAAPRQGGRAPPQGDAARDGAAAVEHADMSTALAVFEDGDMFWHGPYLPQAPPPHCVPFPSGFVPCYGPHMPPAAVIGEGSDASPGEAHAPLPGKQHAGGAYDRAAFDDSARAAELASLSPKTGAPLVFGCTPLCFRLCCLHCCTEGSCCVTHAQRLHVHFHTDRASADSTGSVYDLIKRELVSLRVESRKLQGAVAALASAQDDAAAAQSQHAAHTAELASLWAANAEMDARLDAVVEAVESGYGALKAEIEGLRAVRRRLFLVGLV